MPETALRTLHVYSDIYTCQQSYEVGTMIEPHFMYSHKGAYILVNLSEVKQLVRGGVLWELNQDLTDA